MRQKVTRQPAIKANEKQMRGGSLGRRRGNDEDGHVVLLSGGGGSAVPTSANGDAYYFCRLFFRESKRNR
jgi:hypothetical protein